MKSVEFSVVIPLYCEESTVDYLFNRLETVFSELRATYEFICIDDGSKDNTLQRLVAHHHRNPDIKVVALSRNFGKEIALSAGLDYAQGRAVIPIDADLQDPPELIADLVAKWQEGYDIVYAKRRSRQGETWFKRATATLFYRLIRTMSPIPIPPDTGDFRLL